MAESLSSLSQKHGAKLIWRPCVLGNFHAMNLLFLHFRPMISCPFTLGVFSDGNMAIGFNCTISSVL